MAAFDFPNSPSNGQSYSANGVTYTYDGTVWKKNTGAQKGDKGDKGQQGPAGSGGSNGSPGAAGPPGPPGQTALKGQKGQKGQTGSGSAGAPGAAGPPGSPGTATKGEKGQKGIDGASGLTGIPTGLISIWYGQVSNIPSGWVLCDGNNSTPDLRNRFVVGAYSDGANTNWPNVPPGTTGGSANAVVVQHDHDADATSNVTDPGHDHNSRGFGTSDDGGDQHTGSNNNSVRANAIDDNTTGITVSTNVDIDNEGESGNNKNLPPYYALCYIMKT